MQLPGCVETPLRFGPDARLFGILCRPDHQASGSVVIIGNTGRDPHFGSVRFGVEFARRLAVEGVALLRIDFSGLGDSRDPVDMERVMSPVFDRDRTPDISAAIDMLETHGYKNFAMHGLCAGAYHALRGALADDRIETLLLVNIPVFTLRLGDEIDFIRYKTFSWSHYLQKLGSPRTWLDVLRGEVDVVRFVRAKFELLHEKALLVVAERFGGARPLSFARSAMAMLSRREARTLLLFAPGEGGVSEMEKSFGHECASLRNFPGASMKIVPGLDHDLSERRMRQTASDS